MTLQRRGPLVESVKFGMVRVYLEDIEEIFQVLEKLAKSVRIQADDFVATDPQDLVDIPAEVIDSLTLVATEPSITVTLSKYVASAQATDADMTTLGALKRIEEIVRKRNRPFKKFIWSISTPPKEMRLGDFLVTIVMAGLFAGFVVLLSPEEGSNELRLGTGWTVVLGSLIGLYTTKRGERLRGLAVR